MPLLQVAEFAPDMPDLATATNIATNVIALTPQSYGPVNAPSVYSSNSLPSTCIGMGYGEDSASVSHIFAGTSATLQVMDGGSDAWTDVSGSSYSGTGQKWRFAQYNNLMLATDFADPIQSYNMISGGTFAELSTDAPKARLIAVAKTFAIAAFTTDPVSGTVPQRIWWSAAGDPTAWPTPGSTTAQQDQSDYNDLIGPQGQIRGLAPNLAGCDCAVFFERGVFRMIYVGPPDIFDFYPAASVKGTPAPNSIVPFGQMVYYFGEDGFYAFDGNSSIPIGANKVDNFFFSSVDESALDLIVGAPDIQHKAIIWFYRSIYAPTSAQDSALIYRWDIQRWSWAQIATEWATRVSVPEVVSGVPLSAGELALAAIDGSGNLVFFQGTPLPSQVGTQVVQLSLPGRAFLQAARPLVNSVGSGVALLTEAGIGLLTESSVPLLTEDSSIMMTVSVSARVNYYDPETFGAEVAPDISGSCNFRSDGRYHRGRITIPSGLWTTMFGLDVTNSIRAGLR